MYSMSEISVTKFLPKSAYQTEHADELIFFWLSYM